MAVAASPVRVTVTGLLDWPSLNATVGVADPFIRPLARRMVPVAPPVELGVTVANTELLDDVAKYCPVPPLIATLATSGHVASVTDVGDTVKVACVGAGVVERVFVTVTVVLAPVVSTMPIAEPPEHVPVAVTVNRPGLLVTIVGETMKPAGCETE